MLGLQDRGLVPVVRRQGHSPNVPWLIECDPAVQRVLRTDIDNPEPQHAYSSSRRESKFSFHYSTQLRLRSTLREG